MSRSAPRLSTGSPTEPVANQDVQLALREINRKLDLLLASHGALAGGADRALLSTIVDVCAGIDDFTARSLWQLARVHGRLRDALETALVDSTAQLGHWLRRAAGARDGPILIQCIADRREGKVYRVMCADEGRNGAP